MPQRIVILVLFTGLVGCVVQPPNQQPLGTVTVSADGKRTTFDNCKLAVVFSGVAKWDKKPNTSRVAYDISTNEDYIYEENTYAEAAGCACFKTLIPSANTKTLGILTITDELTAMDAKITSTSWNETGEFGKNLAWEASMPSPSGPITLIGKLIYQPKCVFRVVSVTNDARRLAQGRQFFNTVSAETTAPSLPTSVSPSNTPERLQQLKDVFDKGLITRDEYDSKRKSLLDAF